MSVHIYRDLTPAIRREMQELYKECTKKDPLTLSPLSVDEDGEPIVACTFHREGQLEAFLIASDYIEEGYWEVSAFTRPECRKQGLFRLLFDTLLFELEESEPEQFFFYCDGKSPDTLGFIDHLSCERLDSEQILVLDDSQAKQLPYGQVTASLCKNAHILGQIHASAFGWSPEESQAYMEDCLSDPDCHGYLLNFGFHMIGCFLLDTAGPTACLAAFCLDPAFQKKGLSKPALTAVWKSLPKHCNKLSVHVAESNEAAYHLYRSSGFQIAAKLDSYELDI